MADVRGAASGFYMSLTGQVDGVQMRGADNLYVKYAFNKGADWHVMAGVEHGVSQISKRSSGGGYGQSGGGQDVMTWNYPLDILFRSSNVHGWPQVVIGVYGLTLWGGDVIRGYGCVHVPTVPGRHVRYVNLYAPVSSSLCQRLTAWLTNNPPEFFDSKFVAQGKGREVTRVRSHGTVKVTFNVSTKNMAEWGYQVTTERTGDMLRAQAALNSAASQGMVPLGSGMDGSRPTSAAAAGQRGMAAAMGNVPPKTALSASTAASLAAARGRSAALDPPSGSNTRESSLVRRGGGQGGGSSARDPFDASASGDELEQKYPSSSLGSVGGGSRPGMRPAAGANLEMQSMGAQRLAPLRQGSRENLLS